MDPRFFSSNDFHTTNLIIMSNTQLFYFWVAAFWSHSALHCFEKSSACVLHVLIWSNFCSAASLSLHSLNIFSDVVLHSLRHAVSASGGGGFGGSFSCLQADSPRSPTISITPARACQLFILSPLHIFVGYNPLVRLRGPNYSFALIALTLALEKTGMVTLSCTSR